MADVGEADGAASPSGGASRGRTMREQALAEVARMHQRGNKLFAEEKYTRAQDVYQRVRRLPRGLRPLACMPIVSCAAPFLHAASDSLR